MDSGYRFKEPQTEYISYKKVECYDKDHLPSPMIRVGTGERYVHKCPKCSAVTVVHAGMRA